MQPVDADHHLNVITGTAFDLESVDSTCGLALIDKEAQILSANTAFFHLLDSSADHLGKSVLCVTNNIDPSATKRLRQILFRDQCGFYDLTSKTDKKVLRLHISGFRQPFRLLLLENAPINKQLTYGNGCIAGNNSVISSLVDKNALNALISDWKPSGSGDSLATIMIGLDGFKQVNETIGRANASQLLNFVAQRLLRVSRSSDTVAYYEGDTFVILQTNQAQPASATATAERLVELLQRPFLIDGQQINISASIGLATAHSENDTAGNLTKHAELALFEAKNNARGSYQWFERNLEKKIQEQQELEVSLRRALFLQEFELFYQPQASMQSKALVGFEALIRWNRPIKGRLSPHSFIALAENLGEIQKIGKWALFTACKEASAWPGTLKVAVNISPKQFENGNLVETIKAALTASGLKPERLELEITEGLLIKDIQNTIKQLWAIQALGVSVAMDDFGTGYSSLNYLNSFPFSKIKIDQSFVRGKQTDKSRALVKAVISLGLALKIQTLAEGVETKQQFDYLAANGCMEAQGYYIGKPVPAHKVRMFVNSFQFNSCNKDLC
ncbi:bifunctional diguanylate cyclase/phosphodiesterase [Nitrosomonas sp.]|uniref:putative bifunctional diguanylate cyclase/phosphodiesterase n=1 Tax=Nitrosomonas sp. TaxID=42353 RepID=UPI002841290F|nr:bifunctional diguanylate cyclase/phosphodiesterase [Nitrosomonas sp.]MDR4513198.1 bifunctional diguanylate cyclase/phosphodiesterase [Nitrosomonas sp.]